MFNNWKGKITSTRLKVASRSERDSEIGKFYRVWGYQRCGYGRSGYGIWQRLKGWTVSLIVCTCITTTSSVDAAVTMNIPLPIHSSPSLRNRESRDYHIKNNTSISSNTSTQRTPPPAAEAINGPVREAARGSAVINDRLIVGVDFGTTFSG